MLPTITQGVFTAILYDVAGWPFYEVRNERGSTLCKVVIDHVEDLGNIRRDSFSDYITIINKCWEELDKG